MSLQKCFVQLNTETMSLQRQYVAIGVDFIRLRNQLVAKQIILRYVRLEISAIVDGCEEMNGSGHVESGHGGVRMDRQFPARCQCGNAQRFGDAAGFGKIGLQDRDGTILDDPVELETRVMVFTSG